MQPISGILRSRVQPVTPLVQQVSWQWRPAFVPELVLELPQIWRPQYERALVLELAWVPLRRLSDHSSELLQEQTQSPKVWQLLGHSRSLAPRPQSFRQDRQEIR